VESGVKAIVFDLDGTLIDSAPDLQHIANLVLAQEGAAPVTLSDARSYIGNGAAVFVSRMMAARGLPEADHARLRRAFIDLYDDATAHTMIYPGVISALDALAAAGYAMGVCTNKPLSPARAVLAHFGLRERFACVVGGDTLAHHKPHPAPLLHAFDLLGAKDHLYVGDSEIDYQTAIAAAVPFAFFTEGYRKSPLSDFPPRCPLPISQPCRASPKTSLHDPSRLVV